MQHQFTLDNKPIRNVMDLSNKRNNLKYR